MARRRTPVLAAAVLVLAAGACGSSKPAAKATTTTAAAPATTAAGGSTTRPGAPPSTAARPSGPCGAPGPAPRRYASVVVFAFENRSWSNVGNAFGPAMPYLHSLGRECTSFRDWTEADTTQSSLTQYVGQVTGARQPGTVNDCTPSSTCSTTADNIFRQARVAGLRAVNFVEGASAPCSASGNAARHVPALYLSAPEDRAHCGDQVRPYTELDVDALPAFAFVTPTLCHDGHDCPNADVDAWARTNVQRVLDSAAYRDGHVAVFIWYDEYHPVPNLWIAPTAVAGQLATAGAGYAGTLAAWESMLGLPCLAHACHAPDLRAAAHA